MGDGIGDFAFWLAIGGMGVGFFFSPIGRALGRWIESHAKGADRDLIGAVDALEGRVGQVEGMETRLLEIEERLDFAERLLVQPRTSTAQESDTPPEPVPTPV